MSYSRERFPSLMAIDTVEVFVRSSDWAGLDHYVKNLPHSPQDPYVVVAALRASYRVRKRMTAWYDRLAQSRTELGDRADFLLRGLDVERTDPHSRGYPRPGEKDYDND